MNLEEFKQKMSSEGMERAQKMGKQVAGLKKELRKKDEEIQQKDEMLRVLFNRCYARSILDATRPLCVFCGMRSDCEKRKSVGGGANNDRS